MMDIEKAFGFSFLLLFSRFSDASVCLSLTVQGYDNYLNLPIFFKKHFNYFRKYFMTKEECLGFFGISDLMELPQAVSRLLALPLGERNRRYKELIALNGHDMSRDWFQLLYEQELAQRKQKGQDFTSMEVASLLARIVRADGSIHEPTAGNGGLLIRTLYESQQRVMPWEWFPSEHQVECWELSDRSVPLLLLNLSIRGVMGVVYHGDVLERSVKARYLLLNRKDDVLGFSEVVRTDSGMIVRKEVGV